MRCKANKIANQTKYQRSQAAEEPSSRRHAASERKQIGSCLNQLFPDKLRAHLGASPNCTPNYIIRCIWVLSIFKIFHVMFHAQPRGLPWSSMICCSAHPDVPRCFTNFHDDVSCRISKNAPFIFHRLFRISFHDSPWFSMIVHDLNSHIVSAFAHMPAQSAHSLRAFAYVCVCQNK